MSIPVILIYNMPVQGNIHRQTKLDRTWFTKKKKKGRKENTHTHYFVGTNMNERGGKNKTFSLSTVAACDIGM